MFCILVAACVVLGVPASEAASPALLLTPLIRKNNLEEARNRSLVDSSLFLNITSHSGFLTVDERHNSNLFFWYFPVAGKPVNETPWIIWLQGGPGASSLAGLFEEIGPFQYDENTKKLTPREWAWSKEFSMVFMDNPVGAGYSFTDSPEGLARNESMYSQHLYTALQQLLTVFPELRAAPLFVAGESFAGHYVPAFAMRIHNMEEQLPVNLKGVMMGNPVIERSSVSNYTAVFQAWGLLDSQGAAAVSSLQTDLLRAVRSKSPNAYQLYNSLLDQLQDIAFQPQTYNALTDDLHLGGFQEYLHLEVVKEALHVGDVRFTFSNRTVAAHLIDDFVRNSEPQVAALLEHYKVMIYCGQLDLTAPCVPTSEERRKHLLWSQREKFLSAPRVPWWFNETMAGYVKSGGNFAEVLVRGAGHLVPIDKPAVAYALATNFIRGLDFLTPPNYVIDPKHTPPYGEGGDNGIAPAEFSAKSALVISILLNVALVLSLMATVVYYVRWKRRNEGFFYNAADADSLSDGILSMS